MMKSDNILRASDRKIGTMLDIDAVTFDHFMTLVHPTARARRTAPC